MCTAPLFIQRLWFWQEIASWGPGVPAGTGATAGRAQWRGTSPAEGWLTCSAALLPPKCRSERNLEGFAGAACCFLRCLAAREPVIKTMGLGISLLLKSSSPAMQRVPFLGAAHARQLRSAARAACSWGHELLHICSLALMWGERAVDKAAHTKQRAGTSQDTERQLLWLHPSKTGACLPIKGERGISRRSSSPCVHYREG